MILDAQHLPGIMQRTPAALEQWALEIRRQNARAGLGDGTLSEAGSIAAYIDGGKWMARCVCGAGVAVLIDHAFGACAECGRVYRSVIVPANRPALEAELLRRRVGSRFWYPGETVEDLAEQLERRPEMGAAHQVIG